jgi:hypothetical protein
MTEGPGAKDAPHPSTHEERTSGQDLFGLGERRSVYDQRLLHWSLGIAVGLAWPRMLVGTCSRRG